MLMTEFYRQTIAKTENEIKMAELEKDFKKMIPINQEKI